MREWPDPVFQKDDGLWYHADETWSDAYGPFETKAEAQRELDNYVKHLEGTP